MRTYTSSFELLLCYDLAMRRFDEAERELDGLRGDVLTLLKHSPRRAVSTGTHLYWTEDGTFIQRMEHPSYTTDVDLPDSLKAEPQPEPDPAAKLDAAMAAATDEPQRCAAASPTDEEIDEAALEAAIEQDAAEAAGWAKVAPIQGGAPVEKCGCPDGQTWLGNEPVGACSLCGGSGYIEADATLREQAANFDLPDEQPGQAAFRETVRVEAAFRQEMAQSADLPDIPMIPPITRRCDLSALERIREEYRNETL